MSKPPAPRTRRGFRLSLFDLGGILAILFFAGLLGTDLAEISWSTVEVSLEVDAASLEARFREGRQWHGLYRGKDKVGFVRLDRRKLPDGFRFSSYTEIINNLLGRPRRLRISVDSELSRNFALRSFEARLHGGPASLSARGVVRGDRLVTTVEGLPTGPREVAVPMTDEPVFALSIRPLLMQRQLEVGRKYEFNYFDTLSASTQTATVEYLGKTPLVVLGQEVQAHHLRQSLGGQQLDSWVNDLGEVLQEHLPLGITSLRETEAEATWGLPGSGTQP